MSSARVPSSGNGQRNEPGAAQQPVRWQAPRGDAGDARDVWQELAGPLSSVALRLRSLRSQHAADTRESRELDELIREVDAAFGAVMRAPALQRLATGDAGSGQAMPSAWPRAASSGAPAGSAMPTGQAREVFDHWVEAGCPTWLPSRFETPELAADELLGHLSDGSAPLPGQIASALGQVSPCSYARGSWLLVWARHSTDGPRCRSYRAARYFLAEADPDTLPAVPAPTAQTHRPPMHWA
jgi:hypothetical protein